ncbi:MAG: DUF4097 family beta strand repeat-containing protein [Thermoanaerobaculales bacterium]
MNLNAKTVAAALFLIALIAPGPSPADAAQKDLDQSERFPSSEGKRIEVSAADLDLQVHVGDIDHVEMQTILHIRGVGEGRGESWIEKHTPLSDDRNQVLSVKVEPGRSSFLGIGSLSARARLRFLVPGHVVPDLSTTSGRLEIRGDFPNAHPLNLRTATGDVEMVGAAVSIDLRCVSGDSDIEVIRPLERFFARSSSGDIRLVGGARDAHVETASGKIWLENLSGSVVASASTGKITLRWDRLEKNHVIRVRSSSARVHLTIPGDAHPGGTLTTTTGAIRSDFPGEIVDEGVTLRLLGDGPVFDVETASGEILLTTRDLR